MPAILITKRSSHAKNFRVDDIEITLHLFLAELFEQIQIHEGVVVIGVNLVCCVNNIRRVAL